MNNTDLSFSDKFPSKPIRGCYLLWRGGVVVYVGQSVNVLARIGIHTANSKISFDEYSYCEYDGDLNNAEAELIARYKPVLNTGMPKNSLYATAGQLKKMFNVRGWKLRKAREKIGYVWKDYYRVSEFKAVIENQNEGAESR